MINTPHVSMYTDGACSGNPGPGGWGVILRSGVHEKELSGGDKLTTNNRMELTAAIEGLKALKKPSRVEIFTDSNYLKDGVLQWLSGWKRNGWKTSQKKPVKNQDLWVELDSQISRHEITWHWIKGHAGHTENERADELARMAIEKNV